MEMKSYAAQVANALDLDELVLYGEVYRTPGAKWPSFHPFGYRLPIGMGDFSSN